MTGLGLKIAGLIVTWSRGQLFLAAPYDAGVDPAGPYLPRPNMWCYPLWRLRHYAAGDTGPLTCSSLLGVVADTLRQ